MNKPYHILIIEDNETMRQGMVAILKKQGHIIDEASDGLSGLELVRHSHHELVVTDYKLGDISGLEVLQRVKTIATDTEVMIITAYGTIELAVQAMKQGAADFITKPFSHDEFKVKINRILDRIREREEFERVLDENKYLRGELEVQFNFDEIVGDSAPMRQIYGIVEKVSQTDSSIIIYGESGTGKELVARAIHKASQRKEKPFIRVSCGALAENLLESELFGHERGAFTGAVKRKKGRFELAHHGTLFLDEIGDIPSSTQLKLLRVLQEKEFERVGGEITVYVDVRIIAATNKDLKALVNEGTFREDLFYRLHVIPIIMPPLRERKEDISLLVNHFLKKLRQNFNAPDLSLEPDALKTVIAYNWPGNVRELENVLERAAVLCENQCIRNSDLPLSLAEKTGDEFKPVLNESMKLNHALEELERQYIQKAMEKANGIKIKAAELLGIKTSALYYKLEKFGLMPHPDKPKPKC